MKYNLRTNSYGPFDWDDGKVGEQKIERGQKGFYFPQLCLVGRVEKWKSRRMKNFFVWLKIEFV